MHHCAVSDRGSGLELGQRKRSRRCTLRRNTAPNVSIAARLPWCMLQRCCMLHAATCSKQRKQKNMQPATPATLRIALRRSARHRLSREDGRRRDVRHLVPDHAGEGPQIQCATAAAAASPPGLCAASAVPHLRRDFALTRCHTSAGTGFTPATSARGLGSPLPHLRRDWAHPSHISAGTGLTPPASAPGVPGSTPATSPPGVDRPSCMLRSAARCTMLRYSGTRCDADFERSLEMKREMLQDESPLTAYTPFPQYGRPQPSPAPRRAANPTTEQKQSRGAASAPAPSGLSAHCEPAGRMRSGARCSATQSRCNVPHHERRRSVLQRRRLPKQPRTSPAVWLRWCHVPPV